ncbi:mitogen-activated protein kinase 13 [Grus japonensis]|uniref:mitogen-activated protein kinase n=1 Tax=Grus japonensis TaxID=30415 RepID=A0ABC9XR75_GRUJA
MLSPCSAIDKKTGEKVAIKKLCCPFQSEIFAKRVYRELMLLKHMQHQNDLKLGNLAVNEDWQLKAKSYVNSLPKIPKKDLSVLFPKANPQAVDLLDKMLQLDVEKCLTATEVLAHPYFDQFRDVEEETEVQQSYDDSLEHEKHSIDEWRSKQFIFFEVPV